MIDTFKKKVPNPDTLFLNMTSGVFSSKKVPIQFAFWKTVPVTRSASNLSEQSD